MSEENKRVVRHYFEELDRRKGTPVDLCADRFRFDVAGLAFGAPARQRAPSSRRFARKSVTRSSDRPARYSSGPGIPDERKEDSQGFQD